MKHSLLLSIALLLSSSVFAQKKTRFNTFDKNLSVHEINWTGSLSFGSTFFVGDLHQISSEKYLSNISLSTRFNKEYNDRHSLQIALNTGQNSGENDHSGYLPMKVFRSKYVSTHMAYRRSLTNNLNRSKPESAIQLHLITGLGYYYANAILTEYTDIYTYTPEGEEVLSGQKDIREIEDDVWAFAIPVGLEATYYTPKNWGIIISITNSFFLNDTIDLYESKINGYDNQINLNFGLCYKFD